MQLDFQLKNPQLPPSGWALNNDTTHPQWKKNIVGKQGCMDGSIKAGVKVEDTDGEDSTQDISGTTSAGMLEQAMNLSISMSANNTDSPPHEPTRTALYYRAPEKTQKRCRPLDPLSRPSGFFHSKPSTMKKQKLDPPKSSSVIVSTFSYDKAVRGPRVTIEGSDKCFAFWTTVDENIRKIHTRASNDRLRRIIDTVPNAYPFLPDYILRGIVHDTELFDCVDSYCKRLNTRNGIKHRIQYEQTVFARQMLAIVIRIVKSTSESDLKGLDTLLQMLAKNSSALHELVCMEGCVRDDTATNAAED